MGSADAFTAAYIPRSRCLLQLSIIGVKHGRRGADGNGIRQRLRQIHARDCVRPQMRQQKNQWNEQNDFPPDREKDRLRRLV